MRNIIASSQGEGVYLQIFEEKFKSLEGVYALAAEVGEAPGHILSKSVQISEQTN